MTSIRVKTIVAINSNKPLPLEPPKPLSKKLNLAELYGRDVFNLNTMRERLPADVFEQLTQVARHGTPLPSEIAGVVAGAMKDWATERGATHYTHWFQPMTGLTAEKHDAFLHPTPDGHVINEFSGKTLICGEPDASSFPSGGLRSTFEARGYTAWDPTSPAFILEGPLGNTLHIPTVFYSRTGDALDRKIPLLRSISALSGQALRVLRLFGDHKATSVKPMVGAEQEYFLVDKRLAALRPDLMLAGRTLMGAPPAKGQEMEDHYFGSIPPRVMAFMQDLECRLLALGIPCRTRHNEVAPAQFEMAPLYEEVNIATDHNMLTMNLLRLVADRHGFICLLHEKPFAKVNGSGKHNNWSLRDSEGNNLLAPGDTPLTNARFLVFLAAVLRAVHKHPLALRLGIVGAGNDHRLGASEAPPAILSVYLGEQLTEAINCLTGGRGRQCPESGQALEIGVSCLPPLPRDLSDRNRTSPFAYTGDKFEFRAVGASQSIAPANIALNSAVASALDDIASRLESGLDKGGSFNEVAREVLIELFKEHEPVIFNGNGYAPEWKKEAARRGLPDIPDTVTALEHYSDPEVMEVFLRHNVLSEREILSRQEILLETYAKTINIEASLTLRLGRSMILPVGREAQAGAAELVFKSKWLIGGEEGIPEEELFHELRRDNLALAESLKVLEKAVERFKTDGDSPAAMARLARDILLPAMRRCREHMDALEQLVPNSIWPLPTYAELMWIR